MKLLEWGFKSLTEYKLFDVGEVVGQARVWGGNRMFLPLVGADGVQVVFPRLPANQRLRAEIIYKAPLKAPIAKGDVVAQLRDHDALAGRERGSPCCRRGRGRRGRDPPRP